MNKLLLSLLLFPLLVNAGETANGYRGMISKSYLERTRREGPQPNDKAKDLVDELKWQTLQEMEAAGLKESAVSIDVWSDSYWPTYEGQLANRYADSKFRPTDDWELTEKYLSSHIGQGKPTELSPAEKYDLLVGDPKFTLTHLMIAQGQNYFEANHKVETWMGLCHGWAPASFMEERPIHSVKALAADGKTEITFYPADIKALTTLLWASGAYESRFIGNRCDIHNPPTDGDGRGTNPDCNNTNPATWHLVIVNQIGVSNRPFVFDANFDFEVWNQPARSYSYIYKDVRTGKVAETLAEATLALKDYPEDPKKAHRVKTAEKIVRISMLAIYAREITPRLREIDSADFDENSEATYEYELELNAQDQIVGGEWISLNHPDFLWIPKKNAKVRTNGDALLDQMEDKSEWKLGEKLPKNWGTAGAFSSNYEQPLARIVHSLIRFARQ